VRCLFLARVPLLGGSSDFGETRKWTNFTAGVDDLPRPGLTAVSRRWHTRAAVGWSCDAAAASPGHTPRRGSIYQRSRENQVRHAKTLGLTLLAVFALSAVVVSSAFAAEGEILKASGVSTSKDKGTATFESTGSSIIVKCTSSKGEVTAINTIESTFVEHFEGCTAGGFAATGLGDASKVITVKGKIEVLAFKNGAVLDLAAVYTIEPVHFESLGILTEVRGSVIGLITNPENAKTKTVTSVLKGEKGKESITEVNGKKHHLESETNGSAFVESDQNQEAEATGTEVEVMY
jgi:hypothetical protein